MVMAPPRPGNGVVINEFVNYGREDINAGVDDGCYIYAPKSREEQMRIAAHFFPAELGTPQAYARKTAACAQLMEEIKHTRGLRSRSILQEAISHNDFTFIMGDALYRELIAGYGVPDSPM